MIVLPRRVIPQPPTHINPGGDCAACVLGGLLGMSTIEAVYARFKEPLTNWWGFRTSLYEAQGNGDIDRIIDDPPIWPVREALATFGSPAHCQSLAWFKYIRMGLEAGYYATTGVSFGRTGPLGHGSDHKILIVGARERREPHPSVEGCTSIYNEILVSCSARSTPDEEWVEVNDFLRNRGGFNAILVRPVTP